MIAREWSATNSIISNCRLRSSSLKLTCLIFLTINQYSHNLYMHM